MSAMASQITGVSIVCSTVASGADQRKHQSSASLASVWGIHRWPVNSPHKRPVTRKMLPVLDSQYHPCWCSGDFRSLCISKMLLTPKVYKEILIKIIHFHSRKFIWKCPLIARFMRPTWGPSGADRNFAIWAVRKMAAILSWPPCVNILRPSDAFIHRWFMSSFI